MTDVISIPQIEVFTIGASCDTVVVESERLILIEQSEQGVPGPPGPIGPPGSVAVTRKSDGPLSALLIVWEDEFGVVRPLDASDTAHIDLICGMTISSSGGSGDVNVQRTGTVDDSFWSWTPGRVYIGANGTLTQTPPVSGYDVLIGTAVSPTRIILNLQDPIELE